MGCALQIGWPVAEGDLYRVLLWLRIQIKPSRPGLHDMSVELLGFQRVRDPGTVGT